ncbi:FmdE family protein [uncultured Helicobacter sp.]|uniref:FmdE family protein n=1 Tax=uncultured Helicobacter sp. TaxID=175537 RepID=UPI00260CB682|nr:FmdE family protein [uncultured Helicobacter sp.]
MKTELWEKVSHFHGHKCPGLAIGYQAALLAKEVLEISEIIEDEDIVCLSETDACGVDAIQVVLKATLGTGSMQIHYLGKHAFNIYNRKNGKKARFVLCDPIQFPSKEEKLAYLLSKNPRDLFAIKETISDFPQKARIYDAIPCAICGEHTAQNALIFTNDKQVCKTCQNS